MRQAARGDLGVVLRSGAASPLRRGGKEPPLAGDGVVAGDDGAPRNPARQLVAVPLTPVTGFGPLPQLADGHEGHPHPRPDDVPIHPGRSPLLLDQGCDVRVDDDIREARLSQ
jgi:hypothetical protein